MNDIPKEWLDAWHQQVPGKYHIALFGNERLQRKLYILSGRQESNLHAVYVNKSSTTSDEDWIFYVLFPWRNQSAHINTHSHSQSPPPPHTPGCKVVDGFYDVSAVLESVYHSLVVLEVALLLRNTCNMFFLGTQGIGGNSHELACYTCRKSNSWYKGEDKQKPLSLGTVWTMNGQDAYCGCLDGFFVL